MAGVWNGVGLGASCVVLLICCAAGGGLRHGERAACSSCQPAALVSQTARACMLQVADRLLYRCCAVCAFRSALLL